MFIVSQDGNKCEEIKSFEKHYKLSDDGEKALRKIESNSEYYYDPMFMGCRYKGYANDDELKKDIEKCYAEYEECYISVNGALFGKYKKNVGDGIFNDIIYSLNKSIALYDLRNWEEMKQ